MQTDLTEEQAKMYFVPELAEPEGEQEPMFPDRAFAEPAGL